MQIISCLQSYNIKPNPTNYSCKLLQFSMSVIIGESFIFFGGNQKKIWSVLL